MIKAHSLYSRIIKAIIAFLILFCQLQFCNAKEGSGMKPASYNNQISMNLMGATPILGINYQRNFLNRIGVEVGAGYLLSYGAGMKVYLRPIAPSRLNAYLGASYTHWEFLAPFNYIYMAPGVSYRFEDHFFIAYGAGIVYMNDIMFRKWHFKAWGNLSFGIVF